MLRSESLTLEWVIGAAVGFLAVTAALVLTDVQTWEAAMMAGLLHAATHFTNRLKCALSGKVASGISAEGDLNLDAISRWVKPPQIGQPKLHSERLASNDGIGSVARRIVDSHAVSIERELEPPWAGAALPECCCLQGTVGEIPI